jgi:hypothetical protein
LAKGDAIAALPLLIPPIQVELKWIQLERGRRRSIKEQLRGERNRGGGGDSTRVEDGDSCFLLGLVPSAVGLLNKRRKKKNMAVNAKWEKKNPSPPHNFASIQLLLAGWLRVCKRA